MSETTTTDLKLSYAKGLFAGLIEEELIFPYPAMRAEEQETLGLLFEQIDRFMADKVDSQAIDQSGEIPEAVRQGVADLGLMGLIIPEEYGGFGMSITGYARVMEHLSRHDASVTIHIGCHQSIGMKALLLYGTPEQKKRWLPRCATGELVCAYALTEPGAGSDAGSITTSGRHDPGRNAWVLNGRKQWITNGGYADLVTVFARTPVEISGTTTEKVTCFMVERALPGFSSGRPEKKLGIRGSSTTDIVLEDCPVPESAIIGELGKGYHIGLEVLNSGRLTLASGAIGAAKEMVRQSLAHAEARKAFGRPIIQYEMIEEKFAEMAVSLYAMEAMTYLTCGLVDRGASDYAVESAMCKVFCSERYWEIVNHAVQVAAGTGYMAEYPYERFLRDARINLIFEGTNEVLRMFIALSGLQKPGDFMKEVGRAMKAPVEKLGVLREYATRHIRWVVQPSVMEKVAPPLKGDAEQLSRATARFAEKCEGVLTRYRREILQRQYLQKRLADVAIDLYAASACLSRASAAIEERGETAAQEHIRMAHTFCNSAWRRVRRNLRLLEHNPDRRYKEVVTWLREKRGYVIE